MERKWDLVKDEACFVCGRKNPRGLHLKVEKDGDKGAVAEFLAEETYKGWSRYLHGGVVSLIFDELLGWTSCYLGYTAVTARVEVRYRHPIPIGSRVTFKGRLQKEEKGLLFIRTEAFLPDGTLAAEGMGKMMVIEKKGG